MAAARGKSQKVPPGIQVLERKDANGRKVTRYRAYVDLMPDGSGKRRRVTKVFGSLADAKDWHTATQAAASKGDVVVSSASTVREVSQRWLDSKVNVRPKTKADYLNALKVHVWSRYGSLKVQSLTRAHVEALVSEMRAAGKSPRTVQLVVVLLRAVLEYARKHDLIVKNVADGVETPALPESGREAMSADQVRAVLAAASGNRLYALFLLAFMGLRRGEIVALTWADVDFGQGTVSITKSKVNGVVGAPKTKASRRVVEMPGPVMAALAEMQRARRREALAVGAAVQPGDFLAIHGPLPAKRKTRGCEPWTPIRSEWLSDQFQSLCAAAGVVQSDGSGFTLHQTRHAAVTLVREAGMEDQAVARFLGHSEEVMRKHYAKPGQRRVGAVGDTLAGLFMEDAG